MRKIFLSMLVALVAMTSCEKSDLGGSLSGETAMVTISAEAQAVTRALDDTHTGTLTYYVEIYLGNEETLKTYTEAELLAARYYDESQDNNGYFEVELLTNQDYTVLAWADYCESYYDTDNLTNVTVKTGDSQYAINTTLRDAFAGAEPINVTTNADITMELVRPFGRVNVKSTDDIPEGFAPSTVDIIYETIYTTYNILNGAVGGAISGKDVSVSSFTVDYQEFGSEKEEDYEGNLSTDYLFAPLDGSITVSFEQIYSKVGKDITSYNFTNIPVQANYQTNVSGKILTDGGTIDIDVTSAWDDNSPLDVIYADNVSDANTIIATAITAGATNLTVNIGGTSGGTITLPQTDATIYLIFENAQTADLTVTDEELKDFAGKVYIYVPSIGNLNVDLPEGSFEVIDGSKVAVATVYTQPSTFTVATGAEVDKIVVAGGNVDIYGDVDELESDVDVVVTVYDGADKPTTSGSGTITTIEVTTGAIVNENNGKSYANLAAAIEAAEENDVISLGCDLEETITSALSISKSITIDGGDYTITMTDDGQFIMAEGVSLTVNNITLDASTAIAAIYLNGDGCSLTANSATIIQSAHSTASFLAGSSPAIEVNQTAYADNISMTFNDSHIKLTGGTGTKTGINIYGNKTNEVENYSIIFNNSSIIADQNSDGAQSLYAQAICIGNVKNLNIEMYNSIFQDLSYPIYCTNISDVSNAPEMNFTIDNSTIDGWCAMNLRCNNSTINVVNGSQLIGRNYQSGSSNGYSVIVMSGYTDSTYEEPYISQVANTTINIVDSYMLAESYGDAGEYLIHERNVYNEDNNVINFKGNTVLESNKMSGDYTNVDPFFVKYAPLTEGTSNLKVTRDATVEVKTNMDGMRFSQGLIVGEGTEEDPYQIFDNGDLSILKYYTTASYSAYFKQMADIEYEYIPYVAGQTPAYGAPIVTLTSTGSSVSGIETTYAVACNLNGTYDGGGFAINNFRYDESVLGSNTSDQLVGLFNTVKPGSAIKNLSLTTDTNVGITITEANASPSAMKVGSFAGKLEGTITKCSSEIPITVYGKDAEYTGVGGIVGWFASDYWTYIAKAYCTEVTYCTYSGDLKVENLGIGAGMAAYCSAYWGDITYDTMSGSITAPTAYGICVDDYNDKDGNEVTGTVTSTN